MSDIARGDEIRGEEARGGNVFLSRGAPEEGLPTLLLGVILRSPSLGVKGRPPGLGVKLRPAGLGVKLRPAGLGVKLRPAGLGVKLRPAGLGVKLRPAGLGVKLRPAGLGVKLRPPGLGVKLRPAGLGVKLRPLWSSGLNFWNPHRGAAGLGLLLNPSRGFVMRGRAVEVGPSFPAARSVRFTSFDSVDDAGFALCTRGRSPIGFALSAGRRVVGRADDPERVGGLPVDRFISRRGGGIGEVRLL